MFPIMIVMFLVSCIQDYFEKLKEGKNQARKQENASGERQPGAGVDAD